MVGATEIVGSHAGKLAGLRKHVAAGSYAQGKSKQERPNETRQVHSRSVRFQRARDVEKDPHHHEQSFDAWTEQGSEMSRGKQLENRK